MKRTLLVIGSILLAGVAANADNLVSNPGFETGDLSAWTLSGTDSAPPFNGIFYGVDAQDAHSGAFGAYFGPLGGVMTLSQNLTVVPNVDYTISLWLAQAPAASEPYTNSVDVGFGGYSWFSQTNAPQGPFTKYSVAGVSPSSSTALQFSFRDDTGFFSLDDVSVSLTPTPEPSSWLLLPLGLICLFAWRTLQRAAVGFSPRAHSAPIPPPVAPARATS